MNRSNTPKISLLVPCYNEETSVHIFLDRIIPILRTTGCPYEMLFINDGSKDRTVDIIRELRAANESIRLISLARNFGKEAALTAGLDHATGDVVIPIDVDLQDPPELIPQFLEKWREGYDIAYGLRTKREEGVVKTTTAAWFFRLFNSMSRTPIVPNAGDFRLIDRRVVEEIKRLRERTRFMKGLMSWPGFKSAAVPFVRPPRAAGETSWNYWKLWNFALDGITSFTSLPLRVWLYVGAAFSGLSFLFALYIVYDALVNGNPVPGYPSLVVAISFFGGMQLLSIGLIGEYIARMFEEVKQRPIYVVDFIE